MGGIQKPFIVNISRINRNLSHFFFVFLTFGLVFNLSFTAAPFFSTGRLSFLCMLALYWRDAFNMTLKFALRYPLVLNLFLLLIPFSMAWLAINGTEDTVMLSRAFFFLIFSVLGAFLYVRMCRFNLSLAMIYYMIAMLIQALLVFITVLDPDFRDWVQEALVTGGNIDFSAGVRFSGLTNSGAASVAVQLGLGVAASLVLFSLSRSAWSKLGLLLAAIMITIATIFVGRTGLYLSLLMLFGFILLSRRSLFISVLLIGSVWMASSFISSVGSGGIKIENNEVKLDRTVNWAFDIFLVGESSTADALVSELKTFRELSAADILVGTGRVTETDGSNFSKHDSGYIHSLFALGLPLAISFYAALFWVYWSMLRYMRGKLKVMGLILVALVFILEVKEPFIFKYTLPFFVLVYLYLAQHRNTNKVAR